MPIHNTDIARIFNRIADLLEISNASPFRVRAYRNAARTIVDKPQSIAQMLKDGADLSELPDICTDLAGKIAEIVESGNLAMLDGLEKDIPGTLADLLEIDQLGPKRVAFLHRELNINDLDDLAEAVRAQTIQGPNGFGMKIEAKILKKLERHVETAVRSMRAEAEQF
ncbi:MAG: hypothetical protein JRD88_04970 [Deltaproteobacteria bacterium]|jgi:DNA polymerase (family 10)|nr:hypothetical protein [Deltaproteobacteria bacterium]